jgi:DNA-binding response OmpR family regulator
MKKTIYIADDEPNIRGLIKTFLQSEGFAVQDFADGDALWSAFQAQPADMVILDVMMAGTDGLTLCARIREVSPVPIIIVSARDGELDRITGITLGSDDYLTKPFSPMELVARVKALFRRAGMALPSGGGAALSLGPLALNTGTREATLDGAPLDLTPTEFALTAYLLSHKDRAVSREELLKNVWQFDFDADTRAADDVVKRLRRKLQGSAVRIVSVWGFGFRLEAGHADD